MQPKLAIQLNTGWAGRDHSLRRWPRACKDVIADRAANLNLNKMQVPGCYCSGENAAAAGVFIGLDWKEVGDRYNHKV